MHVDQSSTPHHVAATPASLIATLRSQACASSPARTTSSVRVASCFTLEPGFARGTRQTVDYIKVCSPDPKELNEWAVANLGFGLRSLRCQHCDPASLGLTD
jgi:hypothetical protein